MSTAKLAFYDLDGTLVSSNVVSQYLVPWVNINYVLVMEEVT